MKIAVISDTHDDYPSRLPSLLRSADEIWHLGDVVAPHVLAEFELLDKPMSIVMGNCDYHPVWPLTLTLEREGVLCHLVHIPPSRSPGKVQAILHGHTHIPRDYVDSLGVRWLNPGSVSLPRGGFPASFAWLKLSKGRLESWEIVRV